MLLNCYRALDLTGSLGSLCGRILADLGADLIKIEPPGGDPERNLSWAFCNANKRGITLNLETGQELFLRLVSKADFVLESFQPGALDRQGLGYARLARQNPGLILVSITPFGQQGPYRDFQGSDLEIMALGGAMSLAGEKNGTPMRVSVPQAPMWVGAEAALGAMTALAFRHATGRGQQVDVSAQVAVMSALAHAPAFWDLGRTNPERAGVYITGRSIHGAKMRAFWPCKDGWVNFILYGGAAGRWSNQQLVNWMDENGMATVSLKQMNWDHFDAITLTQEEVDRLEAPIGDFFLTLSKREFLEGVLKRRMLGYPVSTAADIHQDPQLAARCFWQDVCGTKFPGGFAIVNGRRLPIRRPAPSVGQHNREVYGDELGLSTSEMADAQAAGIV